MGNSSSSNTVNDVTNVLINVLVSATQECQSTFANTQNLSIKATGGSTVNIGNIDWSEVINVDASCISTVDTQSTISTDMQQAIQQMATAINQSLDFNPGSTDANNVTNITTNLGTTIIDTFNQSCVNTMVNSQNVEITAGGGSTVSIASLDWNETIDAVTQCIQNDSAVNNVKEQLIQQIIQKAESIVESLLGPLIMLLVIILVIIGAIIFLGVKGLTDWRVLLVVAGLIGVYLTVAYFRKWWPFD